VEKGVREAIEAGVLAGLPRSRGCACGMFDGSHHSVDLLRDSLKIGRVARDEPAIEQA